MSICGITVARLHCCRFCWVSSCSRSFSTLLWPSLSLSRLCWYSSNCSSNLARSCFSLSASRWHCLSLSCSPLSCSSCWLSLCWHSLSHCSFSWRSCSWSRWAVATSSFRFSRLRCFSCSCRVLPRGLEQYSRFWARGEGRSFSCRKSLWTS